MKTTFEELYLDAIRLASSETKSDNTDTIYSTSKGFMEKLQRTFADDLEEVQHMTGREINAYLLYALNPKSIMDCFWIGHFVGAWTHHTFINKGHFYKNGFHTNMNDDIDTND